MQPRWWAIGVVLAFACVSFATIGRYGMSWDEPAGLQRGYDTIKLIEHLLLPHIEPDLELTWVHAHPSFYATVNYLVSEVLIRWFGWAPLPAGHFLNIVTACAGLLALFALGERLFNARVGFFAVLFMAFFPRLVAHAQFNAKDIPVMALGTIALLLLHRAATSGRTRDWIYAAFGFACSVTTKLDGLFLIPIFFVPWFYWRQREGGGVRRDDWRRIGIFGAASLLFIYLLWPELWLEPPLIVRSIIAFSRGFRVSELTYLGETYAMNDLPWHYQSVHLLVVTPLVSLLALAVGLVLAARHWRAHRSRFALGLVGCWVAVPLLARMLPGTVQYNGMRHVFLVVPALALIAGVGASHFGKLLLEEHRQVRRLVWPAVVLAFAWLAWQTIQAFPHQEYYLNEVARRIVPPAQLPAYLDLKGWGADFKYGLDWLNEHAPPHATIAAAHDEMLLQRYEVRPDLVLLPPEQAVEADYVMVGGWRDGIMTEYQCPEFRAQLYGVDLLGVFRNRTNDESAETETASRH